MSDDQEPPVGTPEAVGAMLDQLSPIGRLERHEGRLAQLEANPPDGVDLADYRRVVVDARRVADRPRSEGPDAALKDMLTAAQLREELQRVEHALSLLGMQQIKPAAELGEKFRRVGAQEETARRIEFIQDVAQELNTKKQAAILNAILDTKNVYSARAGELWRIEGRALERAIASFVKRHSKVIFSTI